MPYGVRDNYNRNQSNGYTRQGVNMVVIRSGCSSRYTRVVDSSSFDGNRFMDVPLYIIIIDAIRVIRLTNLLINDIT